MMYGKLDLTIMVVDGEDMGTIEISARQPQVDKSVHATLDDKDGGVKGVEWQWWRSELVDTNDDGGADSCALKTGDTWKEIGNAKSPAYTPGSATFDHDNLPTPEVAYCLRATATYTDDISGDSETAHGVSEAEVQAVDPANGAPEFANDQDLNTPGDQADAMRSVPERLDDEPVGGAVTARDDDPLLTYSLSGDDATTFKTDNNGQISTAMKLDFETKSEYIVVLTATDPSGATDTINVIITVTNVDDPADITGDEAFEYAENGTDAVATFSAVDPDADAGDIAWDLEGPDDGIFKISDDGVLTFDKSPNFEDKKDGNEKATSTAIRARATTSTR